MKFKKITDKTEIRDILDCLLNNGKYEDQEFIFEIKVKLPDQPGRLSYKICRPTSFWGSGDPRYTLSSKESNYLEAIGDANLSAIEFIILGTMTAGQELALQRKRIKMICPIGNHEYDGLSTSVACPDHAKTVTQRRWRANKKLKEAGMEENKGKDA